MCSFFMKSDASFLQKLSQGATGTQRVMEDLRAAGHTPIEMERGSSTAKIWKKVKIKRERVPDIICVECGLRVESRAKASTAFNLKMSHSAQTTDRFWDAGLNDGDCAAFVACTKIGAGPTDWQASQIVHYVRIEDMVSAMALTGDACSQSLLPNLQTTNRSKYRHCSCLSNLRFRISRRTPQSMVQDKENVPSL